VQLDEVAHDGEPESHALLATGAALPEPIEHVRQELRLDSRARIADF
jgi:hypothetical protein